MNSHDKQLVENLTRSKIFRDYAAAFRTATGLPLTFTSAETWTLPLHDTDNESPFCRLMAKTSKVCAACLRLQEELRGRAVEASATAACFSGLRDSVVPVKLGHRLVGFLHTGQVFLQQPTEDDFQRAIDTLARWGVAANHGELRAAFFACKIVSPEQYAAILQLLAVFAEQLGAIGNQILVTQQSADSPQVTQAREFIAKNLTEDIRLADCARAAHMSAFYFCKTFKRATGLTFTEYLSRLRIERAKDLLLDPHVRVSEAAFEVGFQSLSQFNRSFKRVTGQSPSDYRHTLPALADRPQSGREPASTEPRGRTLERQWIRTNGHSVRRRLACAAA